MPDQRGPAPAGAVDCDADIVRIALRARRRNALAAVATVVLLMSSAALAQFGFGGLDGSYRPLPNAPYDGRFTFVRVRYDPAPGGYWPGRRPSWIHGYPLAERNLMKIMNEVSFIGAHDEVNTVTLDDPERSTTPTSRSIGNGRGAGSVPSIKPTRPTSSV